MLCIIEKTAIEICLDYRNTSKGYGKNIFYIPLSLTDSVHQVLYKCIIWKIKRAKFLVLEIHPIF